MQSKENTACEEYRCLMFDYVSDNLSEFEKNKLLLHIKSCPECRAELDEVKNILSAAAEIPELEVPCDLRASVSERLSTEAKAMSKRKRIYKFTIQTVIPVAACAAIAIGIFSGGFYDKVINSDNILSVGVSTPAQNDSQATEASAQPEVSTPVIEAVPSTEVQPKTQNNTPALSQDTPAPPPQTENSQNEPSASGGNSSADIAQDTPAPASLARAVDDGIKAASEDDTAEEAYANVPSSCVVVTENPTDFVSGFGIAAEGDNGEISFELSADRWREFVDYNREYGTSLSVEYSAENSEFIIVTVIAN